MKASQRRSLNLVRTSPEHLTRASRRCSPSLVRGTSSERLRTGRAFGVDFFMSSFLSNIVYHDTISCRFYTKGVIKMDFYATFWALVPPIVAIALALITKEVYSSLFVGILVGGLLYSGFSFEGTRSVIITRII